jgi:hypothetical protein
LRSAAREISSQSKKLLKYRHVYLYIERYTD